MDYIQLQTPFTGGVFIAGLVVVCVAAFSLIVGFAALTASSQSPLATGAIAVGAVLLLVGGAVVLNHADKVGDGNLALFESSYGISRDSIIPAKDSGDPVDHIAYKWNFINDPVSSEMRVQGKKGMETKTYVIDGQARLRLYNGAEAQCAPVKPARR